MLYNTYLDNVLQQSASQKEWSIFAETTVVEHQKGIDEEFIVIKLHRSMKFWINLYSIPQFVRK